MLYTVVISKNLVGTVEIEAESETEALNKAHYKYVIQGKELPDMDIVELEFYI